METTPEPEGYRICLASAGHVPLLHDIERAAATIFPPGYLPAHVLHDAVPQPFLRQAMEESRLWVALQGRGRGTPVGYALLEFRDDTALLAQIDVHPEHGGKGVGRALVRRVVARVVDQAVPALYLTTFADIRWNAPFYASCGFVTLPENDQPDWIKTILQDEREHGLMNRVAMRLQLPQPPFANG
ncbi:MAG: GNAT family N-acetyltransferase [Planctomycetaceae bacterium]|nr:GNAT family N-acetyltransferase [Planctomycetaceae bacterium]